MDRLLQRHSESSFIVDRLIARARSAREVLLPAKYRPFLLAVFVALFIVGMLWSIIGLGLRAQDIDYWTLLVAFVLLVPTLWLNAFELKLCALAVGRKMSQLDALRFSNVATLANLLPLPGAVLVRGAAIMGTGASALESGKIIALAAVLWLVMAAGITAAMALPIGWAFAVSFSCFGGVGLLAAQIARRSSISIAFGFVGVRAGMLGLLVLRLHLCFMAIGMPGSLRQSAVYTVASVIGSAVGIVPAGFGISEGIAAMLALAVSASPEAAFLSQGLNRVLGLGASAIVVLLLGWKFSERLD